MGMTTAEKIRLIVGRRGVTMGEVAEGTGQTRRRGNGYGENGQNEIGRAHV